jgi:phosphoserine phosphatase
LLAAFGDNAFDVALLAEASVGVAVRPKDALRARAGEVSGLVELARVG